MVQCVLNNQGTAGTGKQWNIQILKNGATIAIAQSEIVADVGRTLVTQALVYLNGTTDYLHAQVYASNTNSLATSVPVGQDLRFTKSIESPYTTNSPSTGDRPT